MKKYWFAMPMPTSATPKATSEGISAAMAWTTAQTPPQTMTVRRRMTVRRVVRIAPTSAPPATSELKRP